MGHSHIGGSGGLNRKGAWSVKSKEKRVDDNAGGQSKMVCWGCGAKGHCKWTSSCPAKEKECPVCKKKGHSKAFCWKVKKGGKTSEVMEP